MGELNMLLATGDLVRMEKKRAIGLASQLCELAGMCDLPYSKALILHLAKVGQDGPLFEHLLGHLVPTPQVTLKQFTTWAMLAAGGDRSFVQKSAYIPNPAAASAAQLPVGESICGTALTTCSTASSQDALTYAPYSNGASTTPCGRLSPVRAPPPNKTERFPPAAYLQSALQPQPRHRPPPQRHWRLLPAAAAAKKGLL